jgi:hypothetical protein
MIISVIASNDNKDLKKLIKAVKFYSFDMIRCILDCFVGLYYLKRNFSAKIAGVLGVISSIMAIMQIL